MIYLYIYISFNMINMIYIYISFNSIPSWFKHCPIKCLFCWQEDLEFQGYSTIGSANHWGVWQTGGMPLVWRKTLLLAHWFWFWGPQISGLVSSILLRRCHRCSHYNHYIHAIIVWHNVVWRILRPAKLVQWEGEHCECDLFTLSTRHLEAYNPYSAGVPIWGIEKGPF